MMEKFKKFRKKLILLSAALCVNFSAAPNSQAMGPSQVKKYNSNLEKEDEKSSDGVVRRTVKSLIPIVATIGTALIVRKFNGWNDEIMPEQFLEIIKISGSVGVISSIVAEFGFDTVCSTFSKLTNYFGAKNEDESLNMNLHKKDESASKKKDESTGKGEDNSNSSDGSVLKAQIAGRKFIKTLSDLLVFRTLEVDEAVRSQIREIENEAFYKADVLRSLKFNVITNARSRKIKKVSREVIEKDMQDEFVADFKFCFTKVQAEVVEEKLEEATKKIEKILSDLDAKKKESEKQTNPGFKMKEPVEQKSKN